MQVEDVNARSGGCERRQSQKADRHIVGDVVCQGYNIRGAMREGTRSCRVEEGSHGKTQERYGVWDGRWRVI